MTHLAQPARRQFLVTSAAATALTATAASATEAIAPPAGRRHVTPEPLAISGPQLVIANPGEQPVALRSVRVQTEIVGRIAQTSVEMVFFNPNTRMLEGELQFPLLDGQSVVGFALDIDGSLRDAVPVDKVRGRQVFEDIVRGQVDPGLLTQTAGNHYKLRVYPLPPRGTRTVVIRHAETLVASDSQRVYRLPLAFGDTLDGMAATVRVSGAGAQPPRARWRSMTRTSGAPSARPRMDSSARPSAAPADAPGFTRDGDTWVAELVPSQIDARGSLLEVAVTDAGGVQVTRGDFDGASWFTAEIPLAVRRAPRPAPRRVLLAWDSSGSGASRDHTRELALLDAWFRRIGTQVSEIEVQLQRLRDAAEPVQTFTVVNGRWGALRQALAMTAYDGATDLGALRVPAGAADVVVLVSDGLSNYGERRLPRFEAPMFAIVSAAGADNGRLQRAAEGSGGRLIDLVGADASQAVALDKLLMATTRVIAIEADGATDLVPASPYPRDGRIEVVGRLAARDPLAPKAAALDPAASTGATLRLTLAQPDARPQTISVPLDTRQTSPLAAQMYARTRMAHLDPDDPAQRAEARKLATTFGIAARDTALIVLERAADYVRYDITPPGETKLAEEVSRLRSTMRVARERDARTQLDRVARMFADKQAWWQRDYPKGDRPVPISRQKALRDEPAGATAEGRVTREGERNRRISEAREEVARDRAAPSSPALSATPSTAPSAAPPAPLMALRQQFAGKEMAARADARGGGPGSSMDSADSGTSATIRLQRWTPDAPYQQRLRAAAPHGLYDVYLGERERYARSTAFFLDAADLLFERGEPALAVRVLSNLAELDLDNRHVLRILGLRLLQAGRAREAVRVLQEVQAMAPDEPQSWRDLGLALAADGKHQLAIDTLYEVIVRPWHGRFPEIELITLAELNAIAATSPVPVDTRRVDPRLKANLPLDLRVVMTWDADNTDIDLWVTDPNGDRAFYGNRFTYQGGRMSLDFTGGYGPEEFSLRHAKPGKYKVEANFFGHRQQVVAGATTLHLKLTTGFGTTQAREQAVTMRLRDKGGVVFVGEFDVVSSVE